MNKGKKQSITHHSLDGTHHPSPITHHSLDRTQNTEHVDAHIDHPNGVVWHPGQVSHGDRCHLLGQKGIVLWLTGLSGSGKSTIAVETERRLIEMGKLCYRLDGDNLRHGLNNDLGFSPEERKENIRRVAEVAALFADAGLITLVSFIAPYRDMRRFARERIGADRFIEIYVKATVEACKKRDPKGLYKMAESGVIEQFTGVNAPYELPENPDVILDTESMSLEQCVRLVLQTIRDHIELTGE
ncbi:MAG: adenylyl-sulfate kinase [Acidobacteria bacterium]|nr:adenylyl-sulfate kinase [Acidobacteriota bacterium]